MDNNQGHTKRRLADRDEQTNKRRRHDGSSATHSDNTHDLYNQHDENSRIQSDRERSHSSSNFGRSNSRASRRSGRYRSPRGRYASSHGGFQRGGRGRGWSSSDRYESDSRGRGRGHSDRGRSRGSRGSRGRSFVGHGGFQRGGRGRGWSSSDRYESDSRGRGRGHSDRGRSRGSRGSRGRSFVGRARVGNRNIHGNRGQGYNDRRKPDDDIESFLDKIDASKGADNAEAVTLLSSKTRLIHRILNNDRFWGRFLSSIKFALSTQTIPHLTSLLVKTIMDAGVFNKCSQGIKIQICTASMKHGVSAMMVDLIDILNRMSDFPICSQDFISCNIRYMTEILKVSKALNSSSLHADDINVIDTKLKALKHHLGKKRDSFEADSSGHIDEVDDQSEYVQTKSVFPNIFDFHKAPELLPVNTTSGYTSFKEYMHIQFSLLREDFIGPLRKGIHDYQKRSRNSKVPGSSKRDHYSDIRVYNNVKIVSLVCDHGLNYVVTFDTSCLRNIRWHTSGRLKYGSLVCLSNDNFSTMLVGVIVDSIDDARRKGEMHVEFDEAIDTQTIKRAMDSMFTMIEPMAYFEPYRYVLLKCKHMRQTDLSMTRYIIQCENEILPPKYLRENPQLVFDLSALTCKKAVVGFDRLRPFMDNGEVLDHEVTKPSAYSSKRNLERRQLQLSLNELDREQDMDVGEQEECQNKDKESSKTEDVSTLMVTKSEDGLDSDSTKSTTSLLSEDEKEHEDVTTHFESGNHDDSSPLQKVNILEDDWLEQINVYFDRSQAEAIKIALTKELSIIQGPPGCGKTHIGWQIVKVLLSNSSLWRPNNVGGPILVLCYTNHALDQFMEGIIKFYTGGILRVGGRSSSNALKSHNLKSIRKRMRKGRSIPGYIFYGQKESKGRLYTLRNERILSTKKIKVLQENIIHELALYKEMGPEIANQFEWKRRVAAEQLECHRNVLGWNTQISSIIDWLGIYDILSEIDLNISLHGIDWVRRMEGKRQVHDEGDDILEPGRYISHREKEMSFDDDKLEEKIQSFYKLNVALIITDLINRPDDISSYQWNNLLLHRRELANVLSDRLRSNDTQTVEVPPGSNIYDFPFEQRWCIYRNWVKKKCKTLFDDIEQDVEEYKSTFDKYKEKLMLENRYIMKMADVIGMTTSCAAKYSLELQDVNAKIIVIEEAAEILESHLVSNISKGCEQLILIGDHQQLRPKPSFHRLVQKYNFDVSLFERLILSGLNHATLNQQHRMLPLIADNIRHIYPKVVDDPDVNEYAKVKGIEYNMVFLNHEHLEEQHGEITSHRNAFEASFSISLAKYICQQGYSSDQVTILTTYKGQMFDIMRLKRSERLLEGIRVAVVDNFQGEECDIVILSLVRSNPDGNIGFLRKDNRVCVALSRAKFGLYVLGNFKMFNTSLWMNILGAPSTSNLVLPAIPLRCQNHPDEDPTLVSKADDFSNVPEGGCKLPCDFELPCHHICYKQCHLVDRKHEQVVCQMPCERKCKNAHACKLLCGQDCKCTEPIVITPLCGHETKLLCFEKVECQARCDKKLECGHTCTKACKDECEPCEEPVKMVLPRCGHLAELPCHTDISNAICKTICGCTLDCGHTCTAICGDNENNPSERIRRQSECIQGHTIMCSRKCTVVLECGHRCTGTCSECFQGKEHKPCSRKCMHPLLCNHACSGTCNSCAPCSEPCKRRCPHRHCRNKCFEMCEPCRQPCHWKCPHYACTKRCGEQCDRNMRCYRRCPQYLPCSHRCIGLCGEPCPTCCAVCKHKQEDFRKNCFGSQSFPKSSFVLLEDCGHSVQYKLLDRYFDESDERELTLRQCPICRTPIYNCRRYTPILNRLFRNVDRMKQKLVAASCIFGISVNTDTSSIWFERLVDLYQRNMKSLQDFITEFADDTFIRNKGNAIQCNYSTCISRSLAMTDHQDPLKEVALDVTSDKSNVGVYKVRGIIANIPMPSKQWMKDYTQEVYRYCDSIVLESVNEATLKDEFSQQFTCVMNNLYCKLPYTAEKRLVTIKLVHDLNQYTGTRLQLANISFEVSRKDRYAHNVSITNELNVTDNEIEDESETSNESEDKASEQDLPLLTVVDEWSEKEKMGDHEISPEILKNGNNERLVADLRTSLETAADETTADPVTTGTNVIEMTGGEDNDRTETKYIGTCLVSDEKNSQATENVQNIYQNGTTMTSTKEENETSNCTDVYDPRVSGTGLDTNYTETTVDSVTVLVENDEISFLSDDKKSANEPMLDSGTTGDSSSVVETGDNCSIMNMNDLHATRAEETKSCKDIGDNPREIEKKRNEPISDLNDSQPNESEESKSKSKSTTDFDSIIESCNTCSSLGVNDSHAIDPEDTRSTQRTSDEGYTVVVEDVDVCLISEIHDAHATGIENDESNPDTTSDGTTVLALPRTLVLYAPPCQEYFECNKAPFPEEFQRALHSPVSSGDKRGDKRKGDPKRESEVPSKRRQTDGDRRSSSSSKQKSVEHRTTHAHEQRGKQRHVSRHRKGNDATHDAKYRSIDRSTERKADSQEHSRGKEGSNHHTSSKLVKKQNSNFAYTKIQFGDKKLPSNTTNINDSRHKSHTKIKESTRRTHKNDTSEERVFTDNDTRKVVVLDRETLRKMNKSTSSSNNRQANSETYTDTNKNSKDNLNSGKLSRDGIKRISETMPLRVNESVLNICDVRSTENIHQNESVHTQNKHDTHDLRTHLSMKHETVAVRIGTCIRQMSHIDSASEESEQGKDKVTGVSEVNVISIEESAVDQCDVPSIEIMRQKSTDINTDVKPRKLDKTDLRHHLSMNVKTNQTYTSQTPTINLSIEETGKEITESADGNNQPQAAILKKTTDMPGLDPDPSEDADIQATSKNIKTKLVAHDTQETETDLQNNVLDSFAKGQVDVNSTQTDTVESSQSHDATTHPTVKSVTISNRNITDYKELFAVKRIGPEKDITELELFG